METIAVYWESQIKTYGFNCRSGLCLASMDLALGQAASPDAVVLKTLGEYCREIRMVGTCPLGNGLSRLHLLFEPVPGQTPQTVARSLADANGCADAAVDVLAPVDAVFFQGPHYGDRYGIADAALQALDTAGVAVLAMTCGGSSVCLVLADGAADAACKALETAFVVPQSPKRKKRP